jgi:RNA polymerase sigma factor (sigma-70 family)
MNEDSIVQLVNQYLQESDPEKRDRFFAEIHEILYQPLYGYLLKWAMQQQFPREDAADVLQTGVLAIFDNLHNFRGKTDRIFWGWCYTIIRRKATDHWRRQRFKPLSYFSLEIIEEILADPRLDPVSTQDKLDLDGAMKLLAKALPACRKLLWDHFINDFDIADIAKTLDLKYDAVRMRIRRCLRQAGGFLD